MRDITYLRPLLAWRAWRVTAKGRLTALVSGTEWPPLAPLQARCMKPPCKRCTDPPSWEGRCGIYATRLYPLPPDNTVVGLVWVWGRVVEHEMGFRAEWAYPAALAYAACHFPPCHWSLTWDASDWAQRHLPASEAMLWRPDGPQVARSYCRVYCPAHSTAPVGAVAPLAAVGAIYRIPVLNRDAVLEILATGKWRGHTIR